MNVFRRPKLLLRLLSKSDVSCLSHNIMYNCYPRQLIEKQLYGSLNELFVLDPLIRRITCCSFRIYSTNSNNAHTKLKKPEIQSHLQDQDNVHHRLKELKYDIFQDIKDTKSKVKEKVEEIVERENIYTIPNFLCIARMLVSPYLGFLIVQGNFDFALGVLGLAALTDLLDGWIARTWKSQSSKMGSFLDPMADKILIATLFLTLTYADLIPIALTGLIITRDVFLVGAGFVIRYKSLPPPRTFVRYFDATHATAQLAPTFISKVNTAIQLLLVGSTLAAPVFNYINHPLLQGLWYITGGTTIAAALSYVLSKETYKILKTSSRSKNN